MANSLTVWFYRIFGAAAPKPATTDVMLDYFLSTLDVRSVGLEPNLTTAPDKAIFDTIRTTLNSFNAKYQPSSATLNEAAWNEAYRLERLLALIEPPDHLWPELKRRIAEAGEENLTAAPRLSAAADLAFQLAFDKSTPPALILAATPILRDLLLDTLEELHWASQRKFYSRPIRKGATSRIVSCGMVAFCFFVLPYVLLYMKLWQGSQDDIVRAWTWLPLYTALTAGLFGAIFSRLLYLQQNWDALTIGGLKDARDFTSIVLRGCVGMTGAVIVSFFLQSSVVGGTLFPDFSQIGLEDTSYPIESVTTSTTGSTSTSTLKIEPSKVTLHLIYPSKALALLVVWSFLAGFSERLVPSVLNDTETALGKANKN